MNIDNKRLVLSHEDWQQAMQTPESKETMKTICSAVVEREGSVIVLMPDGDSVARKMDGGFDISRHFPD